MHRWAPRAGLVAALALLPLPATSAAPPEPSLACTRASSVLTASGMPVAPRDLEISVGQMVLVGMEGADPGRGTVEQTRDAIAAGTLGGVMLLSKNLEEPERVRALLARLEPKRGPLRPFIAVDQEGGRVQRLRAPQGVDRMPSAERVAAMGEGAARAIYGRGAAQLAEYGINLNFGPVVDLDREARNPVIGGLERAYGSDPEQVTAFARAFLDAHRAMGVMTALKHFPGHGSSVDDSHEGFTDITQTWDPVELEPFRALLGEADMVMSAHLFHERFAGADGVPVSLSPLAVNGLLREEMGYRGVVVTDDLDMGAIAQQWDFEDAVVRAAQAGNDVLLFSRPTRREGFVPDLVRAALCDGLADGRLEPGAVAQSVERILALKRARGLMVSVAGN